MQLTDWLVVIFIVAIVVVLADGVRRKLSERRTRVVMKLEKNIPQDFDPEEVPNSELPNGGARTIERGGAQPPPTLRTLQARRKLAFKSMRATEDPGTARAVPVLLDTVDIEEERIEHTNVFGDPHAVEDFPPDAFAGEGPEPLAGAAQAPADDDELIDGLDEEYEEDAMLAPEVARKEPGYMETRYMGRRDEDEDDEYEEEEELDEEEEEDEEDEEDFEEFDDDLDDDEFEDDDEEDEEDDDELDDEDDEDDDFDDEDDDYDDEEEDDEEEEEDEDLDELEGLPEDDWGAEEEQDRLVDDYENEPMPLQGAFDKAASRLDRVASQAATQLDKVATQAASQLDKVAAQAANQFDKVASHAANQLDKAATQAASHLKRPPRQETPRIEPGFGGDELEAGNFDDPAFSEDFSAAWGDDALDAAEAISPARPSAERPRAAPSRREQGELFSETPQRAGDAPSRRDNARDSRDENRLMAALQKAVPARSSQPAAEAVAAAPTPQEVIIINVMARQGQLLHGGDLLRVLQGQGMRLGDMSIFHRHADSQGSGPVMFSMANMVKPGTFDLATMEGFSTPGVSFFLQMPNKLGNMACFDRMLATASAVRDTFDAELKDEQRSVFTRQTVEHCRQRVRDFELKLLSRK